MKLICFTLVLSLLSLLSANGQPIEGTWQGKLDVQGMSLRLVLHVEATEDGYTATMDSPDQGAKGIPVDEITFDAPTLSFRVNRIGVQYTGTYKADKSGFVGTFSQGGMTLPLTLIQEVLEGPKPRPQDPTSFDYKVEEVEVKNAQDEVRLAGTLTLPKTGTPSSVVILISGSGPQDRNEELTGMNHRPFLVLSDYLTRQGIGVLRYDERGVGESTGTFAGSTSFDFARDVAAVVAFLRGREDLSGVKVGLAGHSEGGLIAPIVATELADVDFVVLMASPGIPGDELLLLQSDLISTAQGVPDAIRDANRKMRGNAYQWLKAHPGASKSDAEAALIGIFQQGVEDFPEEAKPDEKDVEALIKGQAKPLLDPWFRAFLAIDPATYLQRVDVPVLAINGELDLQVPPTENLAGIKAALEGGKQPPMKIVEMPGLNHLFQTAKTGAPSEYGHIDETFHEAAMAVIATWIKEQ